MTMVVWLHRSGGLGIAVLSVAILTFVSPLVQLSLGFIDQALVYVQVGTGTLVLLILLVPWAMARWARRLVHTLNEVEISTPARIVRINELGRAQVRTLVLLPETTRLTIHDKSSSMHIDRSAIDRVRIGHYGALRADTVVIETTSFGPIELTALRKNGVIPAGDDEALILMQDILGSAG